MARPLALIAGAGALPAHIVRTSEAAGRPVLVCGIAGFDAALPRNDRPFRLETLGSLIAGLKAEGLAEVCFCGAVQRPKLDPAAVDAATAPLVERIVGALAAGGDDAALRIALSLFEDAGLRVTPAAEVAPDLLPPEGVLSAARPNDADGADAGRGAAVVAALGAADVGQACVVRRGQVIAVEALPGTDWMLASLAAAPPALSPPFDAGGILYKAPKPRQDRRVDLPTIGPETVAGAARAGLSGVVLEAGGVMVLDRAATVAAADAAGLFLWVRRGAPDPEAAPR
ncbi:MAG: UDP-2,3-diacylglucosamine diphosphatase LpxI [Pseudomonadota bacterium]